MTEAEAQAAAFDPNTLGPGFYDNPYPTYAALREFDPVHRCADGTYFLTRYADLDQIYRDAATSARTRRPYSVLSSASSPRCTSITPPVSCSMTRRTTRESGVTSSVR